MDQLIYLIPWDGQAANAYLYGSELEFLESGLIHFCNSMMAPGRIIKSWVSRTNFQAHRREPLLPVLHEGENYHIHAWIKSVPENAYVLRFDFFDQQQNPISSYMHHGTDSSFVCPKETFYYTMSLIEGGATELWFYQVELASKDTHKNSTEYFKTLRNFEPRNSCLNILLPQPKAHALRLQEDEAFWNMNNLVLAPTQMLAPEPFFSMEWLNEGEFSKFSHRRYIGYGKESNEAARAMELVDPLAESVTLNDVNELRSKYFG